MWRRNSVIQNCDFNFGANYNIGFNRGFGYMKILTPPARGQQAQRVNSWREIKKDARQMIEMIRKDEFAGKLWTAAYAVAHPQLVTLRCDETSPSCQAGKCGHHKRFFVLNRKEKSGYVKKYFKYDVFINPSILFGTEMLSAREGCMSNEYVGTVNVARYNKIKVEYYIPGWFGLKKISEDFTGLAARIIGHEVDHFRGEYL